jgi:hypothetical protein
MSGYSRLLRSSTDCLHFVFSDQIEPTEREVARQLRQAGILCAYLDAAEIAQHDALSTANALGLTLGLDHSPYGKQSNFGPSIWVPFLDDLITLSHRETGVAIIIDNAFSFDGQYRRTLFGLIEAFLTQFHHWLEKRKPCHLCLQMDAASWVRETFGS